MVWNVPKPSDEESNKEAKHPHDDDQKVAASDSKIEATAIGSQKKQRRRYTKNDRVKLVAFIGEAFKKADANNKPMELIPLFITDGKRNAIFVKRESSN